MKFTCPQPALEKALSTVSKAVSVRTTIPILKGIRMTVSDSTLTLVASDLDLSIETTIPVSDTLEGSAVVSAKLFEDIVRRLPEAMMQIEKDENNQLHISCLSSDFTIVALPAEEFPSIGSVEERHRLTLSKSALKNLIKKTTFSASIDEKRGVLTGCLIETEGNEVRSIALDGFRMAVAQEQMDGLEEKSIIIPARILNEVNKLLSENVMEEDIVMMLDDKRMEIRSESTRLIGRLMEGEFINYSDIIPKNHKTRCVLDRGEMLASIDRASLLAREGRNNLIKMSFSKEQVEITSRSEEGNVKEIIPTELEGEELVIGFNSKYIADALKIIDEEEVVFELASSTSPCLIKPVEGQSFLYLILPVRIAG